MLNYVELYKLINPFVKWNICSASAPSTSAVFRKRATKKPWQQNPSFLMSPIWIDGLYISIHSIAMKNKKVKKKHKNGKKQIGVLLTYCDVNQQRNLWRLGVCHLWPTAKAAFRRSHLFASSPSHEGWAPADVSNPPKPTFFGGRVHFLGRFNTIKASHSDPFFFRVWAVFSHPKKKCHPQQPHRLVGESPLAPRLPERFLPRRSTWLKPAPAPAGCNRQPEASLKKYHLDTFGT